MERKISYEIYSIAFLLSCLTFIVGIYLGSIITNSNFDGISYELSNVSSRVDSLKVLLLLDGNSSSSCPLYLSELSSIDSQIENVGYKLTYLEDAKAAYDPQIKKRYFLLEAESYLLSKKAKVFCSDKSVLLINFYSNKNCSICKKQGDDILRARDELKSKNINVKLFSFDGELGSSIADVFVSEYNVTRYPTIVINQLTYSGPLEVEKIKSFIQSAYYENGSSRST